mgnify:CR=1
MSGPYSEKKMLISSSVTTSAICATVGISARSYYGISSDLN